MNQKYDVVGHLEHLFQNGNHNRNQNILSKLFQI